MADLRFHFSVRSPSATERTGTILRVDEAGVLFRQRRAHSKRYDQELVPHSRILAYGDGDDDGTDWIVVTDPDAEITAVEGRSWKAGPHGYIEVETPNGPAFLAPNAYAATAEEPARHNASKRVGREAQSTPAPQKRRSGRTHKRVELSGDFD